MEYANHLNEYAPAWSEAQVDQEVARIREAAKRNHNTDVYKMCYSAIDLTTLSCNDSVTSVTEFARKAAEFYQKYPHIPMSLRSVSTRHSSRPWGWLSMALRCALRVWAAGFLQPRPSSK